MYIFGVKSVLDGASKFYVQSEHSAEIGDIVSFETNDGEQFAVIEVTGYVYDNNLLKLLSYTGETIHLVSCIFGCDYRSVGNVGTP